MIRVAALALCLFGCGESVVPEIHPAVVVLAGVEEPGERLVWSGRVLDAAGAPISGATIRVHHADAAGLYNPAGTPAGAEPRLSGAATTGADGTFRFETVRPGSYPDSVEPAHLHAQAGAPGRSESYVTFQFEGDPLLTAEHRRYDAEAEEIAIVYVERDAEGVWRLAFDFVLR
jgi:protocatechuate 3,4-dioxygenase beta subunit